MWKKGILRCVSCAREQATAKQIFAICRLLCILNIGSLLPVCLGAECPSETRGLQSTAFACFNNYSTQKMNLDKSDRRLFSGIDVETLRAYCSSYLEGMTCTARLVQACPDDIKQHDIEEALTNLKGLEEELAALCTTNRLYELYAQYMTCFMERGTKSDWCFKNKLGDSVQDIDQLSEQDLCSKMQDATQCIENNIRQGCGEQASELVHKLIKPMVKRSGSCVYPVYKETTEQTTKVKGGTNKPADQGKRDASQTSNNGASSASSPLHYNSNLILFTLIHMSYIAYLHKTRNVS